MIDDDFIVVDQSNLNGNPHVSGTRLTVFDIVLDCQDDGMDSVVKSSRLSRAQIRSVLIYCKEKRCVRGGSYCGGCSLRPAQDGVLNEKDFINRFSEIRFIESDDILLGDGQGMMIMPGSPETLSDNWKGQDGWLIAREVFQCLEDVFD